MEIDEGLTTLRCYSALAALSRVEDSNESTADVEKKLTQIKNIEKTLYFPKASSSASSSVHEEVVRARNAVVASKIYSSTFKWVPDDYYSYTLSKRAQILGAHSTFQLCKSMLMENRSYDKSLATSSDDSTYGRFYLIMLQYETTINNKKLKSELRALRPVKERLDPSKFDFRVATEEDNARLTGYSHNAVTPFGMRENVPIVLSKAITSDNGGDTSGSGGGMSQFIYMGGGHINCKIGCAVADFVAATSPLVLDVTDPR
eukprot:CAMPEP_0194082286 /NCGR_PEP_ID=MMETSP0149-20130528/7835_1 /TAXON_ID=122233 /ORGANISM="Chaetoceros debilis, Strain MM31A-1" /LENGTH=259 /DNA_ID=CAMNT_0038764401 /DNA_START=103 /DNA_END=882 /DNA_ORIENTATION=+